MNDLLVHDNTKSEIDVEMPVDMYFKERPERRCDIRE